MNSQGKPKLIGHIIYPYNPTTKAVFLKEDTLRQYNIYLGNEKITKQQISKKLMGILTEKGFRFEETPRIAIRGITKITGVKIDVSTTKEKKVIKEIVVRVPAMTQHKLISNIRTVMTSIKSTTGIDGKTDVWNKLEKC